MPLEAPPAGAGTVSTVHTFPFQVAANGKPAPVFVVKPPTAMQAADDVQSTLETPLDTAPAGAGAATIDQAAPFQCSTSPRTGPLPAAVHPTARQDDAEAHDTWPRTLVAAAAA